MPSFEGETWAAAWNALGARWEEKAAASEKRRRRCTSERAFLKSYGYYGIARHPFPSTPGKHHGYIKTREMFLAASKYFDIPIERVSIPFQDKADRRSSATAQESARSMIMHWGGIDNWKEERHSFGESFVKEGWGCFIIDSPGTGECPVLGRTRCAPAFTPRRSNICSSRPEVDATRLPSSAPASAAIGRPSWRTAPDKLRAAVNWGGGIHYFFQPEWQERSRHADSYLFDLIEARANLIRQKKFDELCQVMPALSLLDQGWLDKPCAPLLIVNGKEDKQVPLEDFYLLLEHGDPEGDSPLSGRPHGRHSEYLQNRDRLAAPKIGLILMSLYQLQKLIYHVNRDRRSVRAIAATRSIRQELRTVRARAAAVLNVDVRAALYDRRSSLFSAIYLAQQSFQRRLCQSTERIGVNHADRIRLRRQPCARNDRLDGSRAPRASGQFSRQLSKARRHARRGAKPDVIVALTVEHWANFFSTPCPPSASAAPSTMTARSKNG